MRYPLRFTWRSPGDRTGPGPSHPPVRVHVFAARTFDLGRESVRLESGEEIPTSTLPSAVLWTPCASGAGWGPASHTRPSAAT